MSTGKQELGSAGAGALRSAAISQFMKIVREVGSGRLTRDSNYRYAPEDIERLEHHVFEALEVLCDGRIVKRSEHLTACVNVARSDVSLQQMLTMCLTNALIARIMRDVGE